MAVPWPECITAPLTNDRSQVQDYAKLPLFLLQLKGKGKEPGRG